MSEIEETIKMYKQLCKEYTELYNKINSNPKPLILQLINDDYYQLKELELGILQCEAKLRSLEVDF